uniref:Uncharacterized protein n=1 Tax=Myoviridae sp. ctnzH2 TaxID=2827707 RepID=A0A8S5S7T0_9CAUD|nr:MAG TPA: hypothetical protein [Myoviridae sp. ctnzH2]
MLFATPPTQRRRPFNDGCFFVCKEKVGDGPCQRQKMRERTKPLKCISKGLS